MGDRSSAFKSRRSPAKTQKMQNMQILAAHLSLEAVNYRDVDYTQPTCILMGNEKHGVSDEAASIADKHIIIPMLGMVQSLNVSVATAVILFEAQRQRRNAGLYASPQLDSPIFMKKPSAFTPGRSQGLP